MLIIVQSSYPVVHIQIPTSITMSSMRAVVYKGPFEVAVEEVEKPKILHPDDIIVRSKLPSSPAS